MLTKIKIPLEALEVIVNILEEEFNCKFNIINGVFNDFRIISNNNETEIYIKSNFNEVLVLSSIYISKKRSGIGTKIINTLEDIGLMLGFKEFMIESTISSEMNNLCKKLNFKPIEHHGYIVNGEFFGNYIKPLKKAF